MKRLTLVAVFMVLMAPAAFAKNPLADTTAALNTALTKWTQTLATRKAADIVALYDNDAVLLATLDPKPIKDQTRRLSYFEMLTKNENLKASVQEQVVRPLSDTAGVVSGLMTFSFGDPAKPTQIPVRYSFVFEKEGSDWKIVSHHSSQLPKAP